MPEVDIVFVKPGSQKQIYGELSSFNLTAIEPPLWGAILAGYMRGLGYGAAILDAEAEALDWEDTARRIADLNPRLAVILVSGHNPSASTMNMIGAGAILRRLRAISPKTPSLLGGLHPSALPKRTMEEEEADFVCQGEGFTTLPALLDALEAGAEEYPIPGLWYRRDGVVVGNAMAAPLHELDSLPRPAWDLLPMKNYRAHNWHCFDSIDRRRPYAVLYTSLGCPFGCSFCCINALFGRNTIRYRGPASVLDELDFLAGEYGIRNIKIVDEMFALNENRVIALCDAIARRGYDLNIWAYARVNTVTGPMLESMKKAGINWLAYGFESGSSRVIEDVSKGYRPELVKKVVEDTYAAGFHICANYIFGLPEDDYDSMQETLNLMMNINAEWANIYSAMAYPGSRLFEMAMKKGWALPSDWSGYSQYSRNCRPLSTNYLNSSQVLSYRDYAFHAYYHNPRYLNMIKRKFGERTLRHIREMSARALERDNTSI